MVMIPFIEIDTLILNSAITYDWLTCYFATLNNNPLPQHGKIYELYGIKYLHLKYFKISVLAFFYFHFLFLTIFKLPQGISSIGIICMCLVTVVFMF